MNKSRTHLRRGYSTGACAAAVATAAWVRLTQGVVLHSIALLFPDDQERVLHLLQSGYMAAICKDGGDDPDCTHGAVIYANIRFCTPAEARPEDYILQIGTTGTLFVRGVEGIGLCTRPGLDCEQGHWAINTVPRRMIADNMAQAGFYGCGLLELGVINGAELARHTLNAQLGITGGISILGTSGLVHPYSNEAYIQTIRLCINAYAISGGSCVVLCTGGRTRSSAEKHLPNLPAEAFVTIGDFIGEALAEACRCHLAEIIVACMPGKLCKYAAGSSNTHAHKTPQNREVLYAEVRRSFPAQSDLEQQMQRSVSVREALLAIPLAARIGLLRRLARIALGHFTQCCAGTVHLRLLVFNISGDFLCEEATLLPGSGQQSAQRDLLSSEAQAHADKTLP